MNSSNPLNSIKNRIYFSIKQCKIHYTRGKLCAEGLECLNSMEIDDGMTFR